MAEVADKWAPEVGPDASIAKVALGALNGRIDAVLYYLPLAANNAADNTEYVHQLRVWTRRLTAALRLYRDLISKRQYDWFAKQLRRIRRAANDARDSDVLIDRLRNKKPNGTRAWLEIARQERTAAQSEIARVYKRLHAKQRFHRKAEKLLEDVAARGQRRSGRKRFAKWARDELARAVNDFFESVPRQRANHAALHKFRIQAKVLRYTIELFAGAFPAALKSRIYPVVESIQDRLGVVNDHATASDHLQRIQRQGKNGAAAADWKYLRAQEDAQVEKTVVAFRRWFTAARRKQLRAGFDRVLGTNPKNQTSKHKSSKQ